MDIYIKDIPQNLEQEVTLRGWIYNFRSSGSIYFLQLRDGSDCVQVVVSKNEVLPEVWENTQKITIESSVEVFGKVYQDERAPGGFEMQVVDLKIVHIAAEYPISKKEHGLDFLMDHRHLWLRSKRQWAILRVRDTILTALADFFHQEGFIKVDTPILTPNACEGTTTLFEVPYFKQKAYLAQSGQLYLEAAVMSLGRCYDFGPTFRAEKSKTRRHLTEFWLLDAEAAFVDHAGNLEIQEKMISYVIKKVLEKNQAELEILERDLEPLQKIQVPFIRKTHQEVIKELQEMGSDIKNDDDLGADDETMLTKKYNQPIFVEKYPAKVKAFYMKRDPKNSELALCSDLLAPEGYGEIIGGSQREDDYDILLQKIKEENLPLDDFQWYLDLRRYGSVPHSGFGIGLERTVAWLCGLRHVRETIPFPRTILRLRP